ncbi:MAG: hypothetical protein RL223_3708, partial [Pseudomonadota bacterium]
MPPPVRTAPKMPLPPVQQRFALKKAAPALPCLFARPAMAAPSPSAWQFEIDSLLGPAWGWTLLSLMLLIVAMMAVYTVRHYGFTLNRMFGRQRHPYASLVSADWPRVTIFVAAHNEEAVIEDCLINLMGVDYPADRMLVVPVNDRSKDRTREIIDAVVERYPGRIRPFHRTDGKPGKAAALK